MIELFSIEFWIVVILFVVIGFPAAIAAGRAFDKIMEYFMER